MANADRIELVTKLKALCVKRFGTEDAWPQLFDSYDTDRDGLATGAELRQLLTDADVGNIVTRSTWVTQVMMTLDRDEDSRISRQEFGHAIRSIAPHTLNPPTPNPPPAAPPTDSFGTITIAPPVSSTPAKPPAAPKTKPKAAAAKPSTFMDQLVMGLLVGLALMAFQGAARRGRRR
jgi:hypothetical protein